MAGRALYRARGASADGLWRDRSPFWACRPRVALRVSESSVFAVTRDNGDQHLHGLENPFHTEVGYWLWDSATGEVMRGFVVPRGITCPAGGIAGADASSFTLKAMAGDPCYTIGENQYLSQNAATVSYEATITSGDGTWSDDEATMLRMKEFPEPLAHTDHNTTHRVG